MNRDRRDEPVGSSDRTSLAAASLINAVGSLLEQLVDASGMRRQDVAAAMGVTPARISQLLSVDGNVRVATLGRVAEACGATLTVTATLRTTGESITVPRPATRRSREAPAFHDLVPSAVDDVERTGLAAAALINAVGSLMEQTVDLSGVTRRDIASTMNVTPGRVSQLIDGDGNVRMATLARVMETLDAEIILTANMRRDGAVISVPRQATRRRSTSAPVAEVVELASRRSEARTTRDAAETRGRMRELVPLRELVVRGTLPAEFEDQPGAVCELLGILNLWDEPRFACAARRHNVAEPATFHQRAWLACVRAAARSRQVRDLDVAGLRELAAGLPHDLTDAAAFADLPARFAKVGARLVHVDQFSGGKISGVAIRLDPADTSAVIALSGRGKRLDKVLFTLLHESAHVVLGHAQADNVILDTDHGAADDQEVAADALAASWALPGPFDKPSRVTPQWIEDEAARRAIHPIVLIGRLQSDGDIKWGSSLAKGAPNVDDHLKTWPRF